MKRAARSQKATRLFYRKGPREVAGICVDGGIYSESAKNQKIFRNFNRKVEEVEEGRDYFIAFLPTFSTYSTLRFVFFLIFCDIAGISGQENSYAFIVGPAHTLRNLTTEGIQNLSLPP
jgi:hypothetical protein